MIPGQANCEFMERNKEREEKKLMVDNYMLDKVLQLRK